MKETLDMAVAKAHVRPRVLSDNGPCYLARERKDYLDKQEKIDRSRLYLMYSIIIHRKQWKKRLPPSWSSTVIIGIMSL